MSRRGDRRAAAFLLYQRDLMDDDFESLYVAYERDNGEPVTAFTRGRAEGDSDDEHGEGTVRAHGATSYRERRVGTSGSGHGTLLVPTRPRD